MATPIFSISQNRNPAAAATADPAPRRAARQQGTRQGHGQRAIQRRPGSPAALRDQPGDGRAQQPCRGLRRDDPPGRDLREIHPQGLRFFARQCLEWRILCPHLQTRRFVGCVAPSRCAPWSIVSVMARSRLLCSKARNYTWLPGHFDRTLCVRFAAVLPAPAARMFGRKPYVTLDGPSGSTIAARSAIDPMPMRSAARPARRPVSTPLIVAALPGGQAVISTEQVRAELVAHAPQGVLPGQLLWLAWRSEHQPHWHTYWKNLATWPADHAGLDAARRLQGMRRSTGRRPAACRSAR